MKNSEFKKLLENYFAGNLDETQKSRLFQHYDALRKEEFPGWDDNELGNEEQVKSDIYKRVVKRIRDRRNRLIYLSAAAIFFVCFIPLYFFKVKDDLTENSPLLVKKEQLLPGSDKAVLILEDGSQIELDQAENGVLTSQGGIKVQKTKDGHLSYIVNAENEDKEQELSFNTIKTPKAGQYQIQLSDGTKVWLNALSSIRFPSKFMGNERRVEITGEVFFEVAKDKMKPFRVYSSNQVIEVLGTQFNINSYGENNPSKTTLVEGSIRIANGEKIDNPANMRTMVPGEQAIINAGSKAINIKQVDTDEIMAWKNGFFQFNNEDIQSVMSQIERWYDVHVKYEGLQKSKRITGKINRKVDAYKILEMLHYFGVNYTVEGKTIIIRN